jgi:hypothetical protein
MRRLCFAVVALVLVGCLAADAQIVIYDPAVTARNTTTAMIKAYLVDMQRQQRLLIRQMARRLSVFTDLNKYALTEPPRWRIHNFEDADAVLFARGYHAALNYGDASASAYAGVSVPLANPQAIFDEEVTVTALREFAARLATINVADATAISATNDAGRLRYNGRRREFRAIEQLERDVTDPSQEQSTTAVLDKMSAAVLIGARQRQARTQLLVGIVEQLLVDSKRARDTEAVMTNMQLATWRDGRAANDAFVAGTGDALHTWRQP